MVSTIATEQEIRVKEKNKLGFNTVNGKYYCNSTVGSKQNALMSSFNTVNGKYYCNVAIGSQARTAAYKFQYRKW